MPLQKTAGRYEATVRSCEIDEPPGKDPSVRIVFDTPEGEITAWLLLRTTVGAGKQKSPFEVSLDTLRTAFGFDDNFDTLTGQITGKPAVIVTELETHEGKERCRVKWINNPDGGLKAATPPKVTTLASLTAAAKRLARPADAPKPAPKAAPKPAAKSTGLSGPRGNGPAAWG